ncbi:YjdF family protein [Anaerovorax odorimutans]|uniref:YjdF family protein n=1 Tax=Anaerovorax odorimutans TaxID=109327 RepID=A0ABT1RMF1_9FIRM|nr:YjdF family protein [Anaerovorax odorimutans]MCQ4636358.1 YjdF family protein [Anaerovorax odorimutans]
MQKIRSKFTVFFEEPFWVGVYERICDEGYQVCKVTFGAEPKDYEVYGFLSENWKDLNFSKPIPMEEFPERRINPKRMRRAIAKSLEPAGIGTKAQQALKQQQEQRKAETKRENKDEKQRLKQERFERKQKKRKEKHRGH